MKKLAFILSVLLVASTNSFANMNEVNSAIMNSFKTHASSSQDKNPLSIIYGGKDISRPKVAIANEAVWSGQPRIAL